MKSSYRLKKGARPAQENGPGGNYDGRFTQDFEFVKDSGDLDENNGRTGVTPEFPDGTYYYCVTSEFPFIPHQWHGTPDRSFSKGDRPPGGGGHVFLPGRPSRPALDALDLNKDGIIDSDEITKAPQSLKALDKNTDGKITPDEYRSIPPDGPPPFGR
jgi:hypothetical protein